MTGVEEAIGRGFLAQNGLLSNEEFAGACDLIERVNSSGIETIRVMFTDQHGILRGKTIVAEALEQALTSGIRAPSTLLLKDTSHRTAFPVWSREEDTIVRGAADILLAPIPSTFVQLPWSEHSALIHCNVAYLDGRPIPFSSRAVLGKAIDSLAQKGLSAVMGLEVEFQVFEVVDPSLEHADTTMPPAPPKTRALNQGYQFLTETRYGDSEELLDLLRRTAQKMGMPVRSVEIEFGPSQFEFTFAPSDPMTIADMAVNFRTMVKEVCHRNGLLASFMAKPKLPNSVANGWHIHQSIVETESGRNTMSPDTDASMTDTASRWVAGLLENAAASCLMTTPTINGYKRFAPYQLAPNRIGWGYDNRGAMIRAIVAPGSAASRVENRVADSSANPYFALASQIVSGLDGMDRNLPLPDALANPYESDAELLPTNLQSAIEAFAASDLYANAFGSDFVDYLVRIKQSEWQRYLMTVSEWEQMEYFSLF